MDFRIFGGVQMQAHWLQVDSSDPVGRFFMLAEISCTPSLLTCESVGGATYFIAAAAK